ncbi:hypothetical protein AN958_08890 [Leucoagaricus sp. SymC.cos]|nr:hypothetical protein AN958_08890 [Leucoagaricus sp. SymC.cos]
MVPPVSASAAVGVEAAVVDVVESVSVATKSCFAEPVDDVDDDDAPEPEPEPASTSGFRIQYSGFSGKKV